MCAAPWTASTPGGATSRRSSPATSCSPGPPSSPRRSASRSPGCSPPRSAGSARANCSSCAMPSTSAGAKSCTCGRSTARPHRCWVRAAGSAGSSPACHGITSRRSRRSGTATAWRSRSSTTCWTWSRPSRTWASPRATTSRRASTPCRCCRPSPAPGAPSCARVIGGPVEPDQRDRAAEIVRDGDGIDRAIARATTFADAGRAALTVLPDSPGVVGLTAAADYLLDSVRAAAA